MPGLQPAETHGTDSLRTAQEVGSIIVPKLQAPTEALQDMTLFPEYINLLKPILKKYNFFIKARVPIESKYFQDKREYTLISNNIVMRFLLQIPHTILSNPRQENATKLAIIRDLFISNFKETDIILIIFCDNPIQVHRLYKSLIKDWNESFPINIKISCLRDILDLSDMKEKIKEETVEDLFNLPVMTESQKFSHTIRSQNSQICSIEETLNSIREAKGKIHLRDYSNIIVEKLLTEIFVIKVLVSEYEKIQKEINECNSRHASPSSDTTKSERELNKKLQEKMIIYSKDLLPNYEDIVEEVLVQAKKEKQMRKKIVYNYDTVEETETYVNSLNQAANKGLQSLS